MVEKGNAHYRKNEPSSPTICEIIKVFPDGGYYARFFKTSNDLWAIGENEIIRKNVKERVIFT